MRLETFPALEDPAPQQVLVDCRVYERKSCEVPTKCHPASLLAMKEAGWSATIRDISEGGVLVHVTRRFEKGTPLAIELPGNQADEPSVVFVKVVHIKRLDNGGWALGCKFFYELGEDELQRLLAIDDAANAAESESQPPAEIAAPAIPVVAAAPEIVEDMVLADVHFRFTQPNGEQSICQFKRFKATQCWPFVPGRIVRLKIGARNRSDLSIKIQLVECRQENERWHFHANVLQPQLKADLQRALGTRN
jgi:hypothetical protein